MEIADLLDMLTNVTDGGDFLGQLDMGQLADAMTAAGIDPSSLSDADISALLSGGAGDALPAQPHFGGYIGSDAYVDSSGYTHLYRGGEWINTWK